MMARSPLRGPDSSERKTNSWVLGMSRKVTLSRRAHENGVVIFYIVEGKQTSALDSKFRCSNPKVWSKAWIPSTSPTPV